MACGQTSSAPSINVMFLCDEWKSSKGGLSTFNREFAVNLAKTTRESIKVHCYVSQSDDQSKEDARQHGVNLITAQSVPGSVDPLDWLKSPPPELPNPDIVVGHGRKFGTPAYFIVRAAKCKWMHFVHVFCEDLGKFKATQSATVDTIEENEKKHKSEIELCKAADVVVAVGSRLQQKYSKCLPHVKVEIITPGIFEKFSNESTQLVKDKSMVIAKKFNVFMFGRASFEDLTLKGYDIVANAVGSLHKMFELTFVGSSPGEHRKMEQWFLENTCISRNQITIRSYCNEQDELKMMFHESDMVAIPSRTEGFGLVALEAISAGIPVLVAGESGIAEALHEVEGGQSVIVESDDTKEWAQRIQQLSSQSPEERETNAMLLRDNYNKTYPWSKECERFKRMIQGLVESLNALKLRIDVETMKPAQQNTQDRTPVSVGESGGSQNDGHQETSAVSVSSGHTQPSCIGAEAPQAPNLIQPESQRVLSLIASNYLLTTPPRCKADRDDFLAYMKEMRLNITGVTFGSLLITVKCDSLQILERLWEDYSSGHLGEVVQRCFVTEEILTELSLAELKLKTTISEEEYKACKMYFEKDPAQDHCENVAVPVEKPSHFANEEILAQRDDDDSLTETVETDDKDELVSHDEENKKTASSPEKDQENNAESGGASNEDLHHSKPLFRSERATWQTVPSRHQHSGAQREAEGSGGGGRNKATTVGEPRGRAQSRGSRGTSSRSVPYRREMSEGANRRYEDDAGRRGKGGRGFDGGLGRSKGRGQRARSFDSARGRSRGRGGPTFQTRAGPPDPVSLGFTQPNIKYEWNKLYVLGLHHRTTPDGIMNYIERISGYDVKYVRWFKPNGKAIVTLETEKISDFANILREAAKKPLDGVNVLIERAPECKSIYVSGFLENTSREQVETYFDEIGALENVVFNPAWDEEGKDKRAIVYFKEKKSVKKSTKNDQFIDGKPLHVEAFYPFMGTLVPVDQPTRSSRPTSSEVQATGQHQFYKAVDKDIIEFLMKSNQEEKLRELLYSGEHARVKWANEEAYVLIKHDVVGNKVDKEFDENTWKNRCSEIIDIFIASCSAKEFPVEEDIWEAVADQLPQIERILPKFTAQVKLLNKSHTVKLICQKSNMSDFEEKLSGRLKAIKQEELEKKLEQKTLTDITSEKLQLLQNARIEDILKKEFHQDLQVKIDLSNKNLVIKTPKGHMTSVMPYLRQRLDEIDQNAIAMPPEILHILKTKDGKRKTTDGLQGCAFNVDEKSKNIILLGRTPSETKQGREKTKSVLISDRNLSVGPSDNNLLCSKNWDDLCKKMVKRLTIRHKRELTCIAVFGFKQDVTEAVKKMRDFLNEKKVTEGQFRLESSIHRKFFNDYYKDDLHAIEGELTQCGVKISSDESGNLIRFSGTEEGVKEVEERMYVLQDEIKKKSFIISTPGMRHFLAQDDGRRLIETVERDCKCVIEITAETEEQAEDDESDGYGSFSSSSDGEEELDEDNTFYTLERKKVIWRTGNIEEEQADVLVCSVGSKFNLNIGAIANAMSKAAGPALQEELRKLEETAAEMGEGDIVHTGSGNLPCRYVIHCVCCPWKERPEEEEILRELFWKCFDKASELGACSIGLPLVGTGNLGFPYETAVQIMIQSAVDYSQANPESPLEQFRFVVFSGDQRGIATFEEKFAEFKKKHKPLPKSRKREAPKNKPIPVVSEFRCKAVRIGNIELKVLPGDITQESSDAICNVVTQDLDMSSGNLSKVISTACGSTVEEELKSNAPQRPGSVVTTTAGRLSAKHVVHMVVGSGTKQHLQTCVEKALKEVDSLGLMSVSIPAVGSGGLRRTAEDSAKVVFGAIRALLTAKLLTSLREIRVLVFNQSIIGAFLVELEAIQQEPLDLCRREEKDDDDDEGSLEACLASADELTKKHRRQNVIVYGRVESLDAAMAALKDGVASACNKPRVIKHEIISRLPRRYIWELKQMSRVQDVRLDQPEPDTITLEGLPKDVMDMNSEVSNVIQEQMEREHKEERAEQMSKTVQWYLVNPGKLDPFEQIANYDIESAYKANKPSLLFTHQNLKAEINFGNREVTFLRTGAIKRVLRKTVLPLPAEWDPQPLDENGKEEVLHLVSLAQDTQEYKTVQKMFHQSLRGRVSITNIERIQNPSMFNSYMLRKETMDEKNGTLENELQLFHGTKPDSVKSINVQGFNRSLCGVNGAAYGDGVYFAKDASFSMTFSRPSPNGDRYMYLARVLVGKHTIGNQGMKTPPAIDPRKPEILYDSVVNNDQNPTIFVVFNDFHVYPKYLITFKEISR